MSTRHGVRVPMRRPRSRRVVAESPSAPPVTPAGTAHPAPHPPHCEVQPGPRSALQAARRRSRILRLLGTLARACRVLYRPGMKDLVYLVVVLGFFAACWAYAVALEKL